MYQDRFISGTNIPHWHCRKIVTAGDTELYVLQGNPCGQDWGRPELLAWLEGQLQGRAICRPHVTRGL